MTDIINNTSIMPSYMSDHSIIEININLSEFKHGKDYWKFNNSLLKYQNYLDLINKIIEEEKVKYVVPIYNMNFVTSSNETIEFTIPFDFFGDTIFQNKDISVWEQNLDSETNVNLLEENKSVLENIRKQRINGIITRSRIQWLSEGENQVPFLSA